MFHVTSKQIFNLDKWESKKAPHEIIFYLLKLTSFLLEDINHEPEKMRNPEFSGLLLGEHKIRT